MIEMDRQNREHEIRAKLNIGATLSEKERCYYILFMKKNINKKGEDKCDCKNK